MKLSAPPGLSASELLALWKAQRLSFYDEFSRGAVDVTVWTETLDGAGTSAVTPSPYLAGGTLWRLTTGNVIDNDAGIHGHGVINNKLFCYREEGYSAVTWELRALLSSITDLSVFLGISMAAITDYSEPNDSAHFLIDPAVSNTFRARTHTVAEEETDTLVALDTNIHTFKIVWTAASVMFYIDGNLVATHVTRVSPYPSGTSVLIRTEAAATKALDMDYLRVEYS